MKAVSTIVATVLLIGIVVVIAGIVNIWISNFFNKTKDIKKDAETQVGCSNAAISLDNAKYCNGYFSGIIYNHGMADLGNLTIYTLYQNGTLQKNNLNISISSGSVMSVNFTINSNYDMLQLVTNCTDRNDELKQNEISRC